MKTVAVLLSTAFLSVSLAEARPGQEASGSSGACAMVQQALADSRRITPGATRKEVEKHFEYDGGLQFPNQAHYTYRQCDNFKLEVEFDPAPSRGSDFSSPDDTVKKVSKLYIDYPTED